MSKTKKSLVLSCLSMLLCVTMLIGSTFAWFTDTTSTGVNTIQAGTLDIELQMKDASGNWVTAEGETLDFVKASGAENEAILWEPGCTYNLQELRLVNNSNLALKYKVLISGIKGDAKLDEAIDWTIQLGDQALTIGEEMHWLPTETTTKAFTISGSMKKDAGNEYQGLSIEGISITVVATQYTHENDSFGNTYDENAKYKVVDSTDLAGAITSAQPGDVVDLASGSFAMPAGNIGKGVTIAGNGPENTTIIAPATLSGNRTTGLLINKSDVTIKDVKVADNNDITGNEYSGVIDVREGGTTLDNVQVSADRNSSAVVVKDGVGIGETVTIKDSVLKSTFKTIAIVDGANGTVKIDNTDVSGMYTLNVNSSSSQNLVIEVTNSRFHGWTSYGDIKSASFTDTEFSNSDYNFMRPYADTTLTRCTFKDVFKLGAGASGKTYIINDCNFDGTAITAENVESLLLDMTGSDGTNLKNCTIIVNGTTVVLE